MGEGTTRRGTATPVHRPQRPAGSTHSSTRGLRPPEQLERSHLFQNFPQFIVIHTVKGFGIVNKAEIDVFLKLSCFFDDPADVGNLSLVPLPFLKPP